MTEQQSISSLPDSLEWMLDQIMATPSEVTRYENRYGVLSALLNPRGYTPPLAAIKSAYDRYCHGEKAALVELRVELQKMEDRELFEHLRRMTIEDKRSLLLLTGKTFLVILDYERSEQSRQRIPPDILAALLAVDRPSPADATPIQ